LPPLLFWLKESIADYRFLLPFYSLLQHNREQLYKSGGLLSVTSRILVVDMLTQKIPVDLITGIVVLHAETVSPTSLEAFIVRIYRNSNRTGFIKAFSDQPEAFTIGFAPLQTVLQQLKIREVMLWPRFHEFVEMDLRKRKADVIELYQPMTDNMRDIQAAVIECMEATLSEIKRSNTSLDVEDLTVENALFRSFDVLVRSQLDTVWHKVGPKTRQLVSDLTMLRNLQVYLLSFDCVSFNRFLETILSSQNTTPSGMQKENRSPWLFTAAADTIFTVARKRVYEQQQVVSSSAQIGTEKGNGASHNLEEEPPEDLSEEDFHAAQGGPTEDEEAMLREMDESVFQLESSTTTVENSKSRVKIEEAPRAKQKPRVRFLPPGVEPVLEEQPKWQLLAELLDEIEEGLHWAPVDICKLFYSCLFVLYAPQ
jgi:DNA excision repair protein ERCC-4